MRSSASSGQQCGVREMLLGPALDRWARPPLLYRVTTGVTPIISLDFFAARRRAPQRVARHMAAARRTGAGAYLQEWRFPGHLPSSADALVEAVLEWCRDTLGGTRRPWGINEFDLAIAVARDGDSSPRSLSLQRLSPAALYGELGSSAVLDALRRLLDPRDGEESPVVVHVAVALFSWGDAAHAALPHGQPAG